MSDIVPFITGRLARPVSKDLDRIRNQALVRAGRVKATEFVTRLSMQAITSLSEEEARCIIQSPLAEPRLKMLVDSATASMAAEVADISGLDFLLPK